MEVILMSKGSPSSGDFVLPGDYLGVVEEFLPGQNCFIEEGVLRAAVPGIVIVDLEEKLISIYPVVKKLLLPQIGDKCIAKVNMAKKQVASLSIKFLRGTYLPVPYTGSLHIGEVSTKYVQDMFKAMLAGDVIRARVLNPQRIPIQLSTTGRDFGVIFALCSKCGGFLNYLRPNMLKCPTCDHVESRKTARDYGQATLPLRTK